MSNIKLQPCSGDVDTLAMSAQRFLGFLDGFLENRNDTACHKSPRSSRDGVGADPAPSPSIFSTSAEDSMRSAFPQLQHAQAMRGRSSMWRRACQAVEASREEHVLQTPTTSRRQDLSSMACMEAHIPAYLARVCTTPKMADAS